jgi:hypothetical protein
LQIKTITTFTILIAASFGFLLKTTVYGDPDYIEGHLIVSGMVENSLDLTLKEIAALSQTTVYATIYCVEFPDQVVEQGNWIGVKLWYILQKAGVLPEAIKVVFYAVDGYTTDLRIETAQRNDIIIAYEKDGVPLNESLRLVVPGKWGYKWIRDITRIELVDYNFQGTWESQGYSDSADITEGGGNESQDAFNQNKVLPEATSPPSAPKPTQSSNPKPIPIPPNDISTETSPELPESMGTSPNSNMIEEIILVAAATSILIIIAGLLVYFVKIKKKTTNF